MSQRPRGTRDFGPREMALREHVRRRVQGVFERYGYQPIQTPTFEELDLFVAKSGPGVIQELYDFEDKSGRKLTLRPELTAPAMRFYFAEHAFDPKPLKWYYFANCFRYDRPQAGRYREFWQFGCEQIGAGSPLAYAELIALAHGCLCAAGVTVFRLAVGHVPVLRSAVEGLGLPDDARAEAMRLIDKKDIPGLRKRLQEAGTTPEQATAFEALLSARDTAAARRAGAAGAPLAELEACLADLQELGVPVEVDLSIARGLDYYNGIVFEAHVDTLGSQSQVLGGGGYDLSQVFGGQPTPTMGFGMGFDRTVEAAQAEGAVSVEPPAPAVAFGWMSEEARVQVLRWVRDLRARAVAAEMDLMGRKPGKVAEWASAVGARRLVIIGDRDLLADKVHIKELATGETREVALADVVEELSRS